MIILIIQTMTGSHYIRDSFKMHGYELYIYPIIWAEYYGEIEDSNFSLNKTKHFYL
jgi:hypothetical protein